MAAQQWSGPLIAYAVAHALGIRIGLVTSDSVSLLCTVVEPKCKPPNTAEGHEPAVLLGMAAVVDKSSAIASFTPVFLPIVAAVRTVESVSSSSVGSV